MSYYGQSMVCQGWCFLRSNEPILSQYFQLHLEVCQGLPHLVEPASVYQSTVQCEYCLQTVNREGLMTHYWECAGAFVCGMCGETTARARAGEHYCSVPEATATCEYWYHPLSHISLPSSQLPAHQAAHYPTAACPYCQQSVPQVSYSAHTAQCEYAKEQCPICSQYFVRKEIVEHSQVCAAQASINLKATQLCPFCGREVERRRFASHQESHFYAHAQDYGYWQETIPAHLRQSERVNDDEQYGPERYEVRHIQELLKLDGEKYEPGQGLKNEKIRRFPEYREMTGNEECSICQCRVQQGEMAKRLPCMHVFHSACIDNWLSRKPTCPVDHESVQIG